MKGTKIALGTWALSKRLESLADAAGIDTRGDWEHTME